MKTEEEVLNNVDGVIKRQLGLRWRPLQSSPLSLCNIAEAN